MSKNNLFLGMARGSVGDVTFTHTNGVQIARARNRQPKNPKTPLQLLQRVCMKTASSAYSFFQALADHSFQGYQTGTPNQSRFISLNVDRLRAEIADLLANPNMDDISTSDKYNFAPKVNLGCLYNPYQISEGSLPAQSVIWDGNDQYGFVWEAPNIAVVKSPYDITYQDVCDMYGLRRGDQVTQVMCYVNDGSEPSSVSGVFTALEYARIILEPSNGDMSEKFFSGAAPSRVINKPNVRNEGENMLQPMPPSAQSEGDFASLCFHPHGTIASDDAGQTMAMAAAAIIISRQVGGTWQRSTQYLNLRPFLAGSNKLQFNHGEWLIGSAVESFMDSSASSLYLNQAGI